VTGHLTWAAAHAGSMAARTPRRRLRGVRWPWRTPLRRGRSSCSPDRRATPPLDGFADRARTPAWYAASVESAGESLRLLWCVDRCPQRRSTPVPSDDDLELTRDA